MEEILDQENKRMTDSLASKVSRLKSVSSGLFSAFHFHLKGLRGWAEDLEVRVRQFFFFIYCWWHGVEQGYGQCLAGQRGE